MCCKISSLILLLLLSNVAHSAPPVPAAPAIAAKGHLLVDIDSGHVITEDNADQRLEPASLTKIMTTYVVFREIQQGNLKLDDEVLVSEKAWKTGGSRMFIEVGKRVSVEDLVNGMVIQSGNDASVALAEHIAGSEQTFAGLMNEHSRRLGMLDTHFVNSTGLPDSDHFTTPRDIVKVTAATIREFPDLYALYAVKEFTFNDIRQQNRNKLLWRDDSVDGVKTGHTEAAGYCLVSSAKRDGMRLISVVMGTDSEESRARESLSLLNYGFRFFETHRLYGADQALTKTRVWKGDPGEITLGLSQPLYVTIPRRQYDELQARTVLDNRIEAPVSRGQTLGRLVVELHGQPITEVPLVAQREAPEAGLFRSAIDSVWLWFE